MKRRYYGIWCRPTNNWVGEFVDDEWVPYKAATKGEAAAELVELTIPAHRKDYEVRELRGAKLERRPASRRIEAGLYELAEEGKACRIMRGESGMWRVTEGDGLGKVPETDTKRTLDADWRRWATGRTKEPKAKTPAPRPAPPPRKGPPKHNPATKKLMEQSCGPNGPPHQPAPASKQHQPTAPEFVPEQDEVDFENPYVADPLDALFYEGSPRKLTAAGALDEVAAWMRENLKAEARVAYPWCRVDMVLRRELKKGEGTFPEKRRYFDGRQG